MKLGSVLSLTIVAVLLTAGVASAQSTTLQALEDQTVESSFTLNFADIGFQTTSKVISTRFQLQIDEQAGTARFVSYDQQVEPLILPGPTAEGISTGDLRIRIVPGSSSGTYNVATNTFTTSDQFEITFTEDLSALGFASPVVLPATTVGSLQGGTAGAQNIQMNWTGVGQLDNPASPSNPLRFNYACQVNTVIDRSPVTALTGLLSSLCANGTATLMPLTLLGLWLMRGRVSPRRRIRR